MWHQHDLSIFLANVMEEYMRIYEEKKEQRRLHHEQEEMWKDKSNGKKKTKQRDNREEEWSHVDETTISHIQQSALGCVGNMMRDVSTIVPFMANEMYKHIYNIMQCHTDDHTLMKMCLKLLNILVSAIDPKSSQQQQPQHQTNKRPLKGDTHNSALNPPNSKQDPVNNSKSSGVFTRL
ncbi:hypothetical protein RFI_07205 [Reticulomyxa filosa]|uniref:Uncharacterized protein n=1 Tax=Reticulomyxa filosa TaxID=46433 RepID=X6NVS0_RETFI|nr:hypothetical protein RFI_07205 [Reticulomyxa filosa]|eukprot:ETO29914.1 hypothetical protein RFI_07205 [Reticulomyxa filosa]